MTLDPDERRGRAASFAEVADAYERSRPGYPDEAVRWLVGSEPLDVVDLGAGTGKLTRSLVTLGHHVTAVEPLERASFPNVQRLDREGLLDLVLSRSYCAVLGPEERAPVLERVERLFDEHKVEGLVELPYVTECFRAARR